MRDFDDCYGSFSAAWLVLWRRAGPYQQIRMGLDRVREFLKVFSDFAKIFQHLINIFGIYVESLVEPARESRNSGEHVAQIQNGLMNLRTIFANQCVNGGSRK